MDTLRQMSRWLTEGDDDADPASTASASELTSRRTATRFLRPGERIEAICRAHLYPAWVLIAAYAVMNAVIVWPEGISASRVALTVIVVLGIGVAQTAGTRFVVLTDRRILVCSGGLFRTSRAASVVEEFDRPHEFDVRGLCGTRLHGLGRTMWTHCHPVGHLLAANDG